MGCLFFKMDFYRNDDLIGFGRKGIRMKQPCPLGEVGIAVPDLIPFSGFLGERRTMLLFFIK